MPTTNWVKITCQHTTAIALLLGIPLFADPISLSVSSRGCEAEARNCAAPTQTTRGNSRLKRQKATEEITTETNATGNMAGKTCIGTVPMQQT